MPQWLHVFIPGENDQENSCTRGGVVKKVLLPSPLLQIHFIYSSKISSSLHRHFNKVFYM